MLTRLLERDRAWLGRREFCGSVTGPDVGLVRNLQKQADLLGHDGCVNTVSFTPDGDWLLSGSDDRNVVIWDWKLGNKLLEWNTKHAGNVLDSHTIGDQRDTFITCAADGQVRVHYLSTSGSVESSRIGVHTRRAHKMAVHPEQPQRFFSTGEDAMVRGYDLRVRHGGNEKLMVCRSAVRSRAGRHVDLHSIDTNPTRPNEFALVGDEEYIFIYDHRMLDGRSRQPEILGSTTAEPLYTLCPAHLRNNRNFAITHMTACRYSRSGELTASYTNNEIYLFHPELQSRQAREPRSEPSGDGSEGQRPASRPRAHVRVPGKRPRRSHHWASTSGSLEGGLCARRPKRTTEASNSAVTTAPDTASQPTAPEADGGAQEGTATHARVSGEPAAVRATPAARLARWQELREQADQAMQDLPDAGGSEAMQASDGANPVPPLTPGGAATADAVDTGGSGGSNASNCEQDADLSEEDEGEDEESEMRRLLLQRDVGVTESSGEVGGSGSGGKREASGGRRSREHAGVFHALREHVFVEPSELWLRPEDDCVVQRFKGHRNTRTHKGVSFLGLDDEYIMSGSDCGHMFIWSKLDGCLRRMLFADSTYLNCLEPHPHMPFVIATSGIDREVRLWSLDDSRVHKEPSVEELKDVLAVNTSESADQQTPQTWMQLMFFSNFLGPEVRAERARMLRRQHGVNGSDDEDDDDEDEIEDPYLEDGDDDEASEGELFHVT